MTTLHILSRRHDAQGLATLARSRSLGDGLLLSCDAVYLALQAGFLAEAGDCVALATDVTARGLDGLWPAAIPRIDHAGFVALCVAHDKTVSWA